MPGRSRKTKASEWLLLIGAKQREGMSSAPPRVCGGWISMRIGKQSKLPAVLAACGLLTTAILLSPSYLHAGQAAAVAAVSGRTVYTNASPAPAQPGSIEANQFSIQSKIDSIVKRVSNRYQVDPKLVHAMIRVESGYDPWAISSKGAMGLMQLIPSTAHRLGVRNPFDPRENILGGVIYLRYLLNLFGGNLPLSLAAYNAGEERVIRSGGIPAIPETEHYVREVTHFYHSKDTGSSVPATPARGRLEPIVSYVDSGGVIHFTNAE
ncbi:MAG: transglycosylase SLT domain-containing protein [Acidobacteriota bacterium]